MNLQNASLRVTAGNEKQFPPELLPEIAFVGKSNVGKSSLINALLGRSKLARTSSAPGKTRTVNFYEIDGQLLFVDLPGYGYAKVSKEEQARWGRVIESYLSKRETLRAVLLLVDIRHDPSADDRMMYDWLSYYRLPAVVVCTKSDKLSKGAAKASVMNIRKKLGAPAEQPVLAFSAETGAGRDELWRLILPEEAAPGEIPAPENGKEAE